MEAKNKAIELVEKFKKQQVTVSGCNDGGNPCIITSEMYFNSAKQCALICVDEIIKEFDYNSKHDRKFGYWQQVKKEIINLKQ